MAGPQKKDRTYNLHWQAVPMDKRHKSTMPTLLRDLAPDTKFSPQNLWEKTKEDEAAAVLEVAALARLRRWVQAAEDAREDAKQAKQ